MIIELCSDYWLDTRLLWNAGNGLKSCIFENQYSSTSFLNFIWSYSQAGLLFTWCYSKVYSHVNRHWSLVIQWKYSYSNGSWSSYTMNFNSKWIKLDDSMMLKTAAQSLERSNLKWWTITRKMDVIFWQSFRKIFEN